MKKILGKKDKADFPELGLQDIDVKIDTGAYTSSIHCCDIKVEGKGKDAILRFKLLDPKHKAYSDKTFELSNFKYKSIKSSNGKAEKRVIISTSIVLFGISYKIELSLSDRGDMRYPVLLGRKLLNRKFLVDTSLSNQSYKNKQSK